MADSKKITAATETKGAATKVASVVKAEAKKADTAIEKAVENVKKEAKVVEAKAEEVKKTAAKATAKTTTKAAAKKKTTTATTKTTTTAAKSKSVKMHIQYGGHEVEQEELIKRIVDKWTSETGKKESAIKSFNVYVKPEDNAAYYVINEQGSSIDLF